jgi:dolichyl-diphosphooligosaccharide--protein glycosyltransferase
LFGSLSGINFAVNYPPPSYLSAGTSLYTPLFLNTMEFVKAHCKYAIAWWDYGYMIGTVANVTTVVDPATLNGTKIALVARALTGTERDLVQIARALRLPANETCVFAYEVFPYIPKTKTIIGVPQAGGFAKSVWMLRIRGLRDPQIFGHYIMYLVTGETLGGKLISVLVPSPNSIRTLGNAIEVRTVDGRVVIMIRVVQVVPVVNVGSTLLYKMIYNGITKEGYKFQEPGVKLPNKVEFKHLKLLKTFVEKLYMPNTNKSIPNIRAVSVVYLYTG